MERTSKTRRYLHGPLVRAAGVAALAAATLVIGSIPAKAGTTTSATLTISAATGGALNLSVPASLAFPGVTLNGTAQTSSAAFPGCAANSGAPCANGVDVNDTTGSGAGWNVQLSYSQFTTTASNTLAASGTLSEQSAPAFVCDTTGCSDAANSAIVTPVALTAGTASPILDAAAGTGVGDQNSTSNFQIAIPPTTVAGSYSSTFTFTIVSGP